MVKHVFDQGGWRVPGTEESSLLARRGAIWLSAPPSPPHVSHPPIVAPSSPRANLSDHWVGRTAGRLIPCEGRSTSSVGVVTAPSDGTSRFLTFDRDEWADLRAATPMTMRERELEELRGINDRIDLDEVAAIYLPLTRLLNLYVAATQNLHRVSATFLGTAAPKVPYIIGIAGSVAVGKSTFARILQALLSRWPDHPKVDLVTTDGFLFPNDTLIGRGLMNRKGFPESYDAKRLLTFLREVKSGDEEVTAPVYSHVVYDIVDGEEVTVRQPDILILEGLNVLQVGLEANEFVSDYFDFSIYVDAAEADVEQWYIDRFLRLRETVFQDPDSFFRHYAHLTHDEAISTAITIWREINGRNLKENIEPTRSRASLVLRKDADHRVSSVHLRKL
jgi:type I pantothenate kinase